jgi:hypothetical protein
MLFFWDACGVGIRHFRSFAFTSAFFCAAPKALARTVRRYCGVQFCKRGYAENNVRVSTIGDGVASISPSGIDATRWNSPTSEIEILCRNNGATKRRRTAPQAALPLHIIESSNRSPASASEGGETRTCQGRKLRSVAYCPQHEPIRQSTRQEKASSRRSRPNASNVRWD